MSPGFKLVRDLCRINTWVKFEDKIPNDSKVITFTRNHTDDNDADNDDDRTKNSTAPPVGGREGGRQSFNFKF